jgi:hypothetical protein
MSPRTPPRSAATPDMEFYRGDVERWRALFTWLGLGHDPPPALLLRELDVLLAQDAQDAPSREAARRGLLALFEQAAPSLGGL